MKSNANHHFDGRDKDRYYLCEARKHECHIFMIYISVSTRMSGAAESVEPTAEKNTKTSFIVF